MIEVLDLTKRYGDTTAVDGLSFAVQPGRVTGFLGPNGAGKSTTMRMMLGLDAPTSGGVTINGRPYTELVTPLTEVGALLDATAMHGGRRADHHLLGLARSNGIVPGRVDEVLDQVGLTEVAHRRIGTFSLGMRQRLGIGAALLGDPAVLLLDEPVNGLDTEGIRWIRDLLRRLAEQGRTVLLSSHLLTEMELTADHLVVIGRGRLIADTSLAAFIGENSEPVTLVRADRRERFEQLIRSSGGHVDTDAADGLLVTGLDATAIGHLSLQHGIALRELTPSRSRLEDVYAEVTSAATTYRSQQEEALR